MAKKPKEVDPDEFEQQIEEDDDHEEEESEEEDEEAEDEGTEEEKEDDAFADDMRTLADDHIQLRQAMFRYKKDLICWAESELDTIEILLDQGHTDALRSIAPRAFDRLKKLIGVPTKPLEVEEEDEQPSVVHSREDDDGGI